jgi:hypothetical protein
MTRDGIRYRPQALVPRKSAKQLGQATGLELCFSLEETIQNLEHPIAAVDTRQSRRHYRIVMRPVKVWNSNQSSN